MFEDRLCERKGVCSEVTSVWRSVSNRGIWPHRNISTPLCDWCEGGRKPFIALRISWGLEIMRLEVGLACVELTPAHSPHFFPLSPLSLCRLHFRKRLGVCLKVFLAGFERNELSRTNSFHLQHFNCNISGKYLDKKKNTDYFCIEHSIRLFFSSI